MIPILIVYLGQVVRNIAIGWISFSKSFQSNKVPATLKKEM